MDMSEIWKDVRGFEGFYQVSNKGRVRSLDRVVEYRNHVPHKTKGKILSSGKCRGYNTIGLHKNGKVYECRVARLVAIHFIENPNGYPQVNHKDEDHSNDNADNLEWCTQEYNNSYGTKIQRGVDTFKKSRRPFICIENQKIYKSGAECARDLNILSTGVSNVLTNRAYSHKGYHFKYLDIADDINADETKE